MSGLGISDPPACKVHMMQEAKHNAFFFYDIFKEAVKKAVLSNRAKGIPNVSYKEGSLVCEYMNEEVIYTGDEPVEQWIDTTCANTKNMK